MRRTMLAVLMNTNFPSSESKILFGREVTAEF
jgi:hypothetical protein